MSKGGALRLIGPTNNAKRYGQHIAQERSRLGITSRKLANICGCSRYDVESWEAGESFPTTVERKRMESVLTSMKRHWELLPRSVQNESPESAEPPPPTAEEILSSHGKRPGRPVVERPLPKPIRECDSFPEALRLLREREGLSGSELGAMIGVDGSSISGWERGAFVPGENNIRVLYDLWPELADAPQPKTRGGKVRSLTHKLPIPETLPEREEIRAEEETPPPPPAEPEPSPPAEPVSPKTIAEAAAWYAEVEHALEEALEEVKVAERKVDEIRAQLREAHANLKRLV